MGAEGAGLEGITVTQHVRPSACAVVYLYFFVCVFAGGNSE